MGREILELPPPPADLRLPYGPDPNQFGELRLPKSAGPYPVVFSIHGGYWRTMRDLQHMGHLCDVLARVGVASWNIEYRRIGQPGGGWPGTLDDVAAGFDYLNILASAYPLDLSRVFVVGFSAGGHLALWLASQPRSIDVKGAVSLAGMADLRRAWELGLGDGVVEEFLGGLPTEYPERYRSASPIEALPGGVKTRLVHGTEDVNVPIEIGRRFAEAAKARGPGCGVDRAVGRGSLPRHRSAGTGMEHRGENDFRPHRHSPLKIPTYTANFARGQ